MSIFDFASILRRPPALGSVVNKCHSKERRGPDTHHLFWDHIHDVSLGVFAVLLTGLDRPPCASTSCFYSTSIWVSRDRPNASHDKPLSSWDHEVPMKSRSMNTWQYSSCTSYRGVAFLLILVCLVGSISDEMWHRSVIPHAKSRMQSACITLPAVTTKVE